MSRTRAATAYAQSLQWCWCLLYASLVAIRFLPVAFDSYIHPDEHFQCLEVLAGRILGYATMPPWEFRDTPARSLVPLYVIYAPILYTIRMVAPSMLPRTIWRMLRLQNALVNWLVTDFCLYSMSPRNLDRIKSILFTLTCYITMVHQGHLFSNSIETWLVLGCLALINRLRNLQCGNGRALNVHFSMALLAVLAVFGVFNRVTFPVFLAWPSWYVFLHVVKHKLLLITLILVGALSATTIVCLDLLAYRGHVSLSDLVVAPYNNLWYNSNYENLAHHGIHSRFTHLLVNLPQMLGPAGVILLIRHFRKRNRNWCTLPLMSAAGLLGLLSLIPHQEMRFLLPTVPLWCCCFEINSLRRRRFLGRSATSILVCVWLAFNAIMAVFTGTIHQAGIVPALDHLRQVPHPDHTVQVWWRTYSPPTYLLGANVLDAHGILSDGDIVGAIDWDLSKNLHVVDAMGTPHIMEVIRDARQHLGHASIYLICPLASFHTDINSSDFDLVWRTHFHMDMDHLDFSDFTTLRPGLGIFKLISTDT